MIAEALRYADDPNAPARRGRRAGRRRGAPTAAASRWGGHVRRVLMTGVSYMIPFVAAGGLLIALGFLLGGYEIVGPAGDIVVNNTLFNLPDPAALGLDHALFDSGLLRLPRRALLRPRQDGVQVPGPGAGRLHRLRDRRPARHRPRLRDGRRSPSTWAASALPPERLPRRHRRRRPGRLRRALDRALEGRRRGRAA